MKGNRSITYLDVSSLVKLSSTPSTQEALLIFEAETDTVCLTVRITEAVGGNLIIFHDTHLNTHGSDGHNWKVSKINNMFSLSHSYSFIVT